MPHKRNSHGHKSKVSISSCRQALNELCRRNELNPDELILKMGKSIESDFQRANKFAADAMMMSQSNPDKAANFADQAMKLNDETRTSQFYYDLLVTKKADKSHSK